LTNLAPHPVGNETLLLRGRPCYIQFDGEPVFAVLHLPPEGQPQAQTGVIICPPFGWDELGGHRSLRALAAAMAQAGLPALRLDLPGTGDSAGTPRDPRRLEAWTAAIDAAAGALRAASDCERVVAVGVGLGGMVAYRALSLGAPIDDLVLWSVPSRGGLLVREMRTFARMAEAELVDTGLAREDPPPSDADPLAEGDLNVAGFVLTAETLADLEALDLTELVLPEAPRRRVLLLGRDTLPPDRRLRAALEQSGAELAVSDGPGYDTSMVDPHLAHIPWETIGRVVDWVGAAPELAAGEHADRPHAPALLDSIELAVGDAVIRETPIEFDFEHDRLAGVLTEPVSADDADLCVVLLNPGAVRHIGPQRMWVEAARRWGALGVSTLRFDIVAVGDSDGDGSSYPDRGAFQRLEFAAQVTAALDELERRGAPGRFLVGGVCSGAYWGLHAGLADERVRGLLLVNLLAFYWTPELGAVRDSRRARALLHEREVATVVRIMATDRWRITRMLLTKLRGLRRRRGEGEHRDHLVDEVVAVLDAMRDRDVQMTLALSLNEPLFEDFVADGLIDRLGEWPNLHVERIATMEHVFRSPVSQRMAHEVLDRGLARTLGEWVEPPSGDAAP